MAVLQAKQDALQARLAGMHFAPGGWLGAARSEALARLTAMGLRLIDDVSAAADEEIPPAA